MTDQYLYEKLDYGISWTGLFLAPFLQLLILLLPHVSNLVKDRRLRSHLADTQLHKEELLQLKKEQSTISMTDEFARHAKTQRRINAIQDALTAETTEATQKATAYRASFHSMCLGTLSMCIFSTFLYHKSTPLFVFPVQWFAFGPVNWIISFPTGIDGAVGFSFWLFVCRRILNSIYNWIFPPAKKDVEVSHDSNMLSTLMNSMRGANGGASTGAFPGAFPASFPASFPALDAGFDSRESSPESMNDMIEPALD